MHYRTFSVKTDSNFDEKNLIRTKRFTPLVRRFATRYWKIGHISEFFCNFADRLTPCVFHERKRGGRKIKGVYSRFILAKLKTDQFNSAKNNAIVDAHGYVFTYPAHSVPLRHGVSLGGHIYRREFLEKHILLNRFNFGRFFRALRICEVQILTLFFLKNRPNCREVNPRFQDSP